MSNRLLSGPIDLLHASVAAVLMLLILSHLPVSYENYKTRHRVLAGLAYANNAKELVVVNALKGESLVHGWVDSEAGNEPGISIEPHTGIITVTYPADIDGGGKTLNLIPFHRQTNEVYPLLRGGNTNRSFAESDIFWICVSKLTFSKAQSINEHLGTLQSKYAPAVCRYSLR